MCNVGEGATQDHAGRLLVVLTNFAAVARSQSEPCARYELARFLSIEAYTKAGMSPSFDSQLAKLAA
jgi:hypothetical protein